MCVGVEKSSKHLKNGYGRQDPHHAISAEKLPDLNCTSVESAMRVIDKTTTTKQDFGSFCKCLPPYLLLLFDL